MNLGLWKHGHVSELNVDNVPLFIRTYPRVLLFFYVHSDEESISIKKQLTIAAKTAKKSWTLASMDCHNRMSECWKVGATDLPQLKLFIQGNPVREYEGKMNASDILNFINDIY